MGVQTSEVGYPSATVRRGDHEVHKGHVVELAKKNINTKSESSGTQSPTSHAEGPGSAQHRSLWDLWWKNCLLDRFFLPVL
jgi:hypothetical protein